MAFPRVPPLLPMGHEVILRPAHPLFVLITLLVALTANLAPLSGAALALRPDFLALVLLYWCIHEPRIIGVGLAWLVGLLMDVGDATVFGQHALGYAVLAYAGDHFRRRILRFPLWQQAIQVLGLLVLYAGLVAVVRLVGGASMPRWTYLVSPFVGALLWPVLSVVLPLPQRPRRRTSEL